MRILVISTPQASHAFSMVPFCWALRAAGHDVLVVTTGSALAMADAGLPVADFSPGGADLAAELPRIVTENPEVAWGRIKSVEAGWPLMAESAAVFVEPIMAVAEPWRPDLVVHSQLQGAGTLVGARLGIPTVEQGFGLLRTGAFHDQLPALIPEAYRVPGVVRPPACLRIDVAPPSVIATEDGAWPMRFVPYNGGAVVSDRGGPGARPRVAVTIGTAGLAPDVDQWIDKLLSAAAALDAEFVVLGVPEAVRRRVGHLPPGVRFPTGWIPLDQLLAGCTAVVHHGGGQSMMSAFDAGIPQLAVPVAAPNYLQSVAMQERGTGLWTDLTGLEAALERLLYDETLRKAALEVRSEMRAMPTPVDVAIRLTEALG
jgi:UDP:flavonoid glycosyltransferase YjiC (YdhE family)